MPTVGRYFRPSFSYTIVTKEFPLCKSVAP